MSLLLQIERCLRQSGVAPTTFGRRAVNDPRLIGDLKRGRVLREPTRQRVEAAIREIAR